jgi:uncharacterized Zn-finger protein
MYQGCQKEYQTKYNLSRHIEVNHLKKKVGKCDICQKEFIDFENLKEHQNIHKDIKPYKCDTCGKSYRNKCMLVRHARDHKFRPIEKKLAIKYS